MSLRGEDRPLVGRIQRARRWRERLVGLLGRRQLHDDEGLWILPCNSIHTCGMRFDIDVLFLDHNLRVVRTMRDVRPWRFAAARARSVIELAAGSVDRLALQSGDRLHLAARPQPENYQESPA
jgi:uncharacterized membrane protein (UPF0127 family)